MTDSTVVPITGLLITGGSAGGMMDQGTYTTELFLPRTGSDSLIIAILFSLSHSPTRRCKMKCIEKIYSFSAWKPQLKASNAPGKGLLVA